MKNKIDIKLDEIKMYDSLNELEEYLKPKRIEYSVYLPKPSKLQINHTSKEALEYAKKLSEYEELKKENDAYDEKATEVNSAIDDVIDVYIRYKSGLNDIPEQYRDKVYSLAYSRGHSGGHSEIMNELLDLVNIFKQ